jgi:hypothetical protein
MLLRSRTAIAVILALGLAIGVAVMPASATVPVSFVATPTAARFGETVDLQPSVDATQVVPGDKFNVQILQSGDWVNYGEGVQVEDTDTIQPQSIVMDDSIQFPAQFRVAFQPKASKNATESISDPVTVSAIRNTRTKVTVGAPRTVLRKGSRFSFTVSPDSGASLVRIRVLDKRGKLVKTTTILTDEYGYGTRTLTFPKAGTYHVQAQFLGNQFGKASTTAVKTVSAR